MALRRERRAAWRHRRPAAVQIVVAYTRTARRRRMCNGVRLVFGRPGVRSSCARRNRARAADGSAADEVMGRRRRAVQATDRMSSVRSSRLVRKSPVFSAPSVWLPPVIVVAALIFVVTLVYFGSVVDPVGQMHGLPVAVVDQDTGATVGSRHIDFGRAVATGLTTSSAINGRLSLHERSLRGPRRRWTSARPAPRSLSRPASPVRCSHSPAWCCHPAAPRRNRRSSC